MKAKKHKLIVKEDGRPHWRKYFVSYKGKTSGKKSKLLKLDHLGIKTYALFEEKKAACVREW